MYDVLRYINENGKGRCILTGGTALMYAYGLGRFSEGICLDSTVQLDFFEMVERFCKSNGYYLKIAKNTETVQRAIIEYDNSDFIPFVNEPKPLEIEVSYSGKVIDAEEYCLYNGVYVYLLPAIFRMTAIAYSLRYGINDLYDLCFMEREHFDLIPEGYQAMLRDILGEIGLEKCFYLIRKQTDGLLSHEVQDILMKDCLDLFDRLNLLRLPLAMCRSQRHQAVVITISGLDRVCLSILGKSD